MSNAQKKPLNSVELSTFCAQMAMLIKAGITVQEGIHILTEDAKGTPSQEIFTAISQQVEMGSSLHHGLAAAEVFPRYLLQMVEIGEMSGKLDEVMDSLCAYYERSEAISKSVKNAVTYPAVMLGMMAVVVYILVVEVLPIFQQVFQQLGSELSPFALGLMGMGSTVSRYSLVIIGVVVALAALIFFLRRTAGGRAFFQRMGYSFFLTRPLTDKISAGRFVAAMSMMLSSGLDTDQALSMTGDLVEDPRTRDKIKGCQTAISEGSSFADALLAAGLFPPLYSRMVTVGFKTGTVEGVMEKLAVRYEDEIGDTINVLLSVLEPTLVAVLSISVGLILLSVILPLMGVMSSIG